MFRSSRRSRRHRNQKDQEKKQQPFFKKSKRKEVANSSPQPFFQAKLTVGPTDDQYEKEADAVANSVVSQPNSTSAVQKKGIRGWIQRITLATPQEDEKHSTTEERMDRDKRIQEKPEVMAMHQGEEEKAQRMPTEGEEEVQRQEEEEDQGVQMQEEEEPVQKQEEEEPVQKQEEEEGEGVQMQEDEEVQKQEEEEVQAKTEAGGVSMASSNLSNRIRGSAGKGKLLPSQTRADMESSFGVDFSRVNIHTDQNSVEMNKELGAQAFTHGQDIYFNAGKFNPENSKGKHLLAHELTHVVQQNGEAIQRKPNSTGTIQRQVRGGGATPGKGAGVDLIYIIKAPNDQFTADVTTYVKTVLQGQHYKEVNNLQDIFTDLKALGKKVRRIRIVAHGSIQGQIKMTSPGGKQPQWIDAQNMEAMVNAVKGTGITKQVMSQNATVEFWGCNIGDVPKTGQTLAKLFNAKVRASGDTFKTGFEEYWRRADQGETATMVQKGIGYVKVTNTSEIDSRGRGQIGHFESWLLARYTELVANGDIKRIKGRAKRIKYMRELFDRSNGNIKHILIQDDSTNEQVRPGKRQKWLKLWKTFKKP